MPGDETALHAFVLCPGIADLRGFVEKMLMRVERISLSAKSLIKTAPLLIASFER